MRGVGLRSDDGNAILHDVDWEVPVGAVAVLVGSSGAGKSRLLRLVNRLDEPDGGTVEVLGRPQRSWDVGELRRAVGWVPQRPALVGGTAGDNLDLPARLGLIDASAERRRRVCALVGLGGELLSRPVGQLSGGERQRVALARALLLEPRVLLLDEPSSALHGAAAAEVLSAVKAWAAERDVTLAVVTHRLEDVTTLGGDLVVVEAGTVARRGPAAELSGDPEVRRLMTGRAEVPA